MEILYSKQAQKFLFKQNKKIADRIRQGIEELADQNIIKDIRPMEGRHKKEGDMRLHIGTFRVIYQKLARKPPPLRRGMNCVPPIDKRTKI